MINYYRWNFEAGHGLEFGRRVTRVYHAEFLITCYYVDKTAHAHVMSLRCMRTSFHSCKVRHGRMKTPKLYKFNAVIDRLTQKEDKIASLSNRGELPRFSEHHAQRQLINSNRLWSDLNWHSNSKKLVFLSNDKFIVLGYILIIYWLKSFRKFLCFALCRLFTALSSFFPCVRIKKKTYTNMIRRVAYLYE